METKFLEPFKGEGSFYNNLPDFVEKDWCGRYFFIIFKKQPCDFYKYVEGNF